jgi:predicted small secreted protein
MIKRAIIVFFAATLLVVAATGCNTVRGAGEDVENAGATIKNNTPP